MIILACQIGEISKMMAVLTLIKENTLLYYGIFQEIGHMHAKIGQEDRRQLLEWFLISVIKFSFNNGENGKLKTIRAHIGKVWKKERVMVVKENLLRDLLTFQ
jgi:hypothetical protein